MILPTLDAQDVWSRDDVEQNWIRCHKLMKRLGRDGRKLELWKRWLGGYYSEHPHLGHLLEKGKQVQKQWTEDEGLLPSQTAWATKKQTVIAEGALPTLEHVAAVLRIHVSFILSHKRLHLISSILLTGRLYPPFIYLPRFASTVSRVIGTLRNTS
jgi:hypothetical protein